MSEFICPYHVRIVDPDTGESSRVYFKYGKNFDRYLTGDNVANQLRTTHILFDKLHPEYLALYIFDKSSQDCY